MSVMTPGIFRQIFEFGDGTTPDAAAAASSSSGSGGFGPPGQ
jgi:hypothetical protein